jgi:hypothetical protein
MAVLFISNRIEDRRARQVTRLKTLQWSLVTKTLILIKNVDPLHQMLIKKGDFPRLSKRFLSRWVRRTDSRVWGFPFVPSSCPFVHQPLRPR